MVMCGSGGEGEAEGGGGAEGEGGGDGEAEGGDNTGGADGETASGMKHEPGTHCTAPEKHGKLPTLHDETDGAHKFTRLTKVALGPVATAKPTPSHAHGTAGKQAVPLEMQVSPTAAQPSPAQVSHGLYSLSSTPKT